MTALTVHTTLATVAAGMFDMASGWTETGIEGDPSPVEIVTDDAFHAYDPREHAYWQMDTAFFDDEGSPTSLDDWSAIQHAALESMLEEYRVFRAGTDTVADRAVEVIVIVDERGLDEPTTVWVDREYGYPLKFELVVDGCGVDRCDEGIPAVVEFNTIAFDAGVEDERFVIDPPADAEQLAIEDALEFYHETSTRDRYDPATGSMIVEDVHDRDSEIIMGGYRRDDDST